MAPNCGGADLVVISHELGMVKFQLRPIILQNDRIDVTISDLRLIVRAPTLAAPETRNQ